MALIEVKALKKNYNMGKIVVQALRGVDVRIDQGELIAVWGPSGSGKTTLLNLLGALDDPSSGSIRMNGEEITELSDNQKSALRNDSIGFIFQGFNLIPVLTALENVMLPLQITGISSSKVKEKAFQCLHDVELSEFVHHRPDKMSGGQQQRVSIARALATDPSLIIADEPTANLDSETAGKIVGLMRDLNRRSNTTIIFSTHDQRLLDQIDRQIRIEDGMIRNGGR